MRSAEKRSSATARQAARSMRRRSLDGGGGLGGVRDEVAGLAAIDDLAHRPALERDHRRAAHHRLDDREAERLRESDRMEQRSRAAEDLRPAARADRAEVRHPVAVDARLDAFAEVRLVVDDPADHEPAAGGGCDLDRLRCSLVRVDAAERDERVAPGRVERAARRCRRRGRRSRRSEDPAPVGQRDRDER